MIDLPVISTLARSARLRLPAAGEDCATAFVAADGTFCPEAMVCPIHKSNARAVISLQQATLADAPDRVEVERQLSVLRETLGEAGVARSHAAVLAGLGGRCLDAAGHRPELG